MAKSIFDYDSTSSAEIEEPGKTTKTYVKYLNDNPRVYRKSDDPS
jgi:hypothetical protein